MRKSSVSILCILQFDYNSGMNAAKPIKKIMLLRMNYRKNWPKNGSVAFDLRISMWTMFQQNGRPITNKVCEIIAKDKQKRHVTVPGIDKMSSTYY